ncbi:hypothetical protein ET989_00795 [Propioniciclava sinopodophylli]|uniref:SRPBCC domain-containing protein n=1 Tax=Propioniciclava sinopodophylli TaxID=1837344 RepID=A0A4Q9KGS0_9ACTN|nr:hypothetical protein [Propioniciclava sinopodophylli]TBT88524.1 hypothetical protein ET989_00795 [Propioniciclava sinopodophylli]
MTDSLSPSAESPGLVYEVSAESGGRLVYDLAEVDGQTKLTVTTTGGPATGAQAAEGTPWIYSQLKTLLEA